MSTSASPATPAAASAQAQGLSPTTRRISLIISGAFFIEQLDSTIIATAVPDMAVSLGVAPLELNLAMTAYMLGLAVFIPISGKLADRCGSRTVFSAAIAVFLLASALCGFANSLEMLVIARLLQGIGGAMMSPVGRLIVLRTASKSELVEAMALIMVPTMVAPMMGPLVGGLFTTYLSWRWVFFVNLPIGAIALLLIFRHVANERLEQRTSFDPIGIVLLGACFAALTLGLEFLSRGGADADSGGLLCAAGVALFAVYGLHARRHGAPVLDLGLMRLSSFRWSVISGSVYRVAVGGIPFLLPVTLQLGYGMSPVRSGAIALLPAVGGFLMKFLTTRILRGFGYWNSLVVNSVITSVLMGVLALIAPGWSWLLVGVVLVLYGSSRSLQMNALGTVAYAGVERPRMASATSFFLAFQNLSVGLGTAFSAFAVRAAQSWLPGAPAHQHFSFAFAMLTATCVLSTGLALFLDRRAGAELLNRH